MKPQPIPRALADKIAALWDAHEVASQARSAAWQAIPLKERQDNYETVRNSPESLAHDAATNQARNAATIETELLMREFPWAKQLHAQDGGEAFRRCIAADYGYALNDFFLAENMARISGLVADVNKLKGQEQTSPPVSGWALDIRSQTAWEIVKASPTGRKVRGKNYRGEFADLKPLVIHGSSVGSGRPSPSRGGWVSCSEELARALWSLRADRDKMHDENPAIV